MIDLLAKKGPLNDLSTEIIAFAENVKCTWSDDECFDERGWQRRYLMSMHMGTVESAKTYWILRECGNRIDARTIARGLLERTVNAYLAYDDPTIAVELIAYDIHLSIANLRKWQKSDSRLSFDKTIARNKQSLTEVEPLLRGTRYRGWNGREKFKKAKLDCVYLSVFSELCGDVHSDYFSALDTSHDYAVCDFVAYVAPLESNGTNFRRE